MVVKEERLPPPSLSLRTLICLHWSYQQGVPREQKSHTELLHLRDTARGPPASPAPHTSPAAGALTCGCPHSSRNTPHTHTRTHRADTCVPAARLFDYPTRTLRSSYRGATCAEQRLRNTSVLIRATAMAMWGCNGSPKQAHTHGRRLISSFCIKTL